MFDLTDDIQHAHHSLYATDDAFTIDEDLITEILAIVQHRNPKLYSCDIFKRNSKTIEILHPTISYSGNRFIKKSPNYIRFLLSLYPYASDLEHVDKIILCPRYVELNNLEIVAAYLRNKKIVVEYLHHPFYYETEGSKFHQYSEFLPVDLTRIHNTPLAVKTPAASRQKLRIPPLWYVLSIIESENSDLVDKFFLRREGPPDQRLLETSFFYSRHGY
ncbi:MAG: hypothetical protein N2316_13360 [Spirochaetes bacterium]|nr:hypothetical protein [Spirochaetota bacterium]